MTIYEIDNAITGLVDPETGEILDYEAFANLQMERSAKIENMALWYKEILAEGAAIRNEEKTLTDRRKSLESKAKRLKEYLAYITDGQKYESPRVAITWRKSTTVELDDDFINWAQNNNSALLRFSEPEPNKTEISKVLKAGGEIHGARLVDKYNMQVK